MAAVIAAALAAASQQGRLDLRYTPCIQFRPVVGVGSGGALRVGVGAEVVPGVEFGVGDGLDRNAAGIAAYGYFLVRYNNPYRVDIERCAAVVTGGRNRTCRR